MMQGSSAAPPGRPDLEATVRIMAVRPRSDESLPGGQHRRRGRRIPLPGGLELNAVALMATSGMTALFGLVFWGVAARYPAEEVGRTSALISTAMMMSVVASLGAGLLFTRFLGSAGERSRVLVLAGYGVTSTIAAVLGGGFVLFFADDTLVGSGAERAAFPLLVVVLALFALQDWVLIGMQAARWVPIEQLLFSGLKLGLVALFAVTAMHNGIVLAWAAPAALAVLVITPVLLLRVLPRRSSKEGAVALPSRRALGTLFLGEYATGATSVIVPLFMPLIVVSMLGTRANAYYALPWLISEAVTVLLWNISSSYITEASNDVRQGPALMRRAWRLSWLIGITGTPFLLVGAPWLLSLLGGEYAEEGTSLLRLMAAALPFTIVHSMYIAVSRVKQQMGRVVALQTLSAVIVVVLALVLVTPLGVDGVGVAYLCAEVVGCAIAAVPLIRAFRANADQDAQRLRELEFEPVTEPLGGVRAEGST
jgi:O-antigen/teichoic acid export membrane protein